MELRGTEDCDYHGIFCNPSTYPLRKHHLMTRYLQSTIMPEILLWRFQVPKLSALYEQVYISQFMMKAAYDQFKMSTVKGLK